MRVALLVALLIILAGCLGGADTNPKNDPRPTTTTTTTTGPVPTPGPTVGGPIVLLSSFGFTGCSGIEAQIIVSPTDAQALLPENFTISADQGPTSDQGMARYRIFSCPQFSATNSIINDTVYGDVSLLIADPSIHESGETHWYRLRIFAADDVLATAWGIAGYDVLDGEVMQSTNPLAQRSLAFAGYQAQWLDAVAASVAEEEVSFTATPGGVLVWGEAVDEAEAVKQGIGTFSVPSGDPLSGLIGADPSKLRLLSHSNTNVAEAALVLVRWT